MQEVSSEITFQLPKEESDQFKSFFQEFDKSLDSLGIKSYGIGVTTLEEVFLRIGHGDGQVAGVTSSAEKGQNLETTMQATE